MLRDTGETWNGKPVLINDMFRAIHDYFGHAKEGVGFRGDGEENAWRSHASMYSPLARLALGTETRGQNSWLNYGPHGEKNRTASTEETVFAPPKIGLMPSWVHHEGGEDFTLPEHITAMQEIHKRHGMKSRGGSIVQRKYAKGGKVEDHVYHGTAHSLLPFIAKNGLDPEASQGMTFFHKNPEESRRYAESAPNQMLGAKRKGALLRVHLSKLPTDALQPLSYSDITATAETIPPQHIEHEQPNGSWAPLSGKAHGGSIVDRALMLTSKKA
jgi:hypothetical protein